MDVSKTRPAPWVSVPCPDRPPWCRIYDANGRFVLLAEAVELADEIALAHNAEDVMMRRRFSVVKVEDGQFSVLRDGDAMGSMWIGFTGTHSSNMQGQRLVWPHPFTALVEADAWYKANVEQAET